MIVASVFSRRELLRRFGMAGAAAIAMPELSRVLLFQREVLAREQVSGSPTQSRPWPRLNSRRWRPCARGLSPPMKTGPARQKHERRNTSTARSADGSRPHARHTTRDLHVIDEAAAKQNGRRFVELAAGDQDAVLTAIQQTPFFALVRTHTIQGTFCDPAYGGNANFAGWDLIGYPGVRLAVTAEDQRMASPAKPVRRSAYDYAMFSAMGATHAH